ncbi:MAG TPA: prolyl-tRNA synthetase associated domain-containing protein [Clostridia bacterium]|nr:prolyl-tRNA synthetase associated domain-containing protein [Clostridia bacterium]
MAIDPRERDTLALLESRGVPYTRIEHLRALTMEDCESVGADLGARHFKNLFLVNRQGTDFYLLLIDANKKFRTAEVSKQLGVSRLSFASDAQLMDKLGLLPGSVTPMALARPGARDVTVVIDRDVLDMGLVCVHPCVSTASLALRWADVFAFIEGTGCRVAYVDVEAVPV